MTGSPQARSAAPDPAPPRLRADAQANRERIVAAARAAFSELGLDVGIDEIARRAGVGVGTIYRRFPTKEALAEAILEERLTAIEGLVDAALADPDPGAGLVAMLAGIIRVQAADRSGASAIAARTRTGAGLSPQEARLRRRLTRMLARAQEAGAARADVTVGDLLAVIWGIGRVVTATRDAAPEYPARYLSLVLRALAPDPIDALPGAPLAGAQITAASRAAAACAAPRPSPRPRG